MDPGETKKGNLEDLTKEELVKKCRGLLSLAQKAKSQKDTLQEENKYLQEQLNKRTQQDNDAAQELIDKLTQEKLKLVTQIEDLKSKNTNLQSKLQTCQEKLNTLETENLSYKRQVSRLTDENEQLLTDLSSLELQITELTKLGSQQQEQLLELEKSNEIRLTDLQSNLSVTLEEVKKLNDNLKGKEKEILELSQELQALKIIRNASADSLATEVDELKRNNEVYKRQIFEVKNVNEKLKLKVTLYHSKLKKFALTAKEIKQEKNQVIQMFKAYTEQIQVWKGQLINASNSLIKLVNNLEIENRKLKNRNEEGVNLIDLNQNKELKKQLEMCENEINILKDQKETENADLKSKFKEAEEKYKTENQSYNESLNSYKKQVEKLNEEMVSREHILKEEILKLKTALNHFKDTEKQFAEKSSEEIVRLAERNKELEANLSQIQEEIHHLKNKPLLSGFTQTEDNFAIVEESKDKGFNLKRENSEMLLEMNQMNQVLKERGETISMLEAHCEEIKKKLQIYETQANKNVDSITEKEETIKALMKEIESIKNDNTKSNNENISTKENEIENLKAEIENLKEKLNSNFDNSYAESETMSTSTISRTEECNRIKDLEGSWEERYSKLRTLAIKLKAKIKEQGSTIGSIQEEKEELQKKLLISHKTFQSLQEQIDKVEDKLEKSNAEKHQYLIKLNSVAESISKDKQLLVQNDETISKLNKEIERMNTEKQSVENWKKQVGAKVQMLRKELEAKNLLMKESENKVFKLEADLESKDKQLKIEQENHKQTKGLLDQTSNECKKNSVLNLEMQDYEKSVKDLSQKVEKQKDQINNLQTQLDTQKTTANALREQNKLLEERIQDEEKNGNSSSLEISTCKKNISNLEVFLQQKEGKILDITKLLETTRSENEELSTELSKVIAEHQKNLNVLKAERDQLRHQISSLQQSLRETQDLLKLKEDELKVVKGDYETYKVRAQSVLKKNQNRDLGIEERLSEELVTAKSLISELNNELNQIRKKYELLDGSSDKLMKENEGHIRKCKQLENEVDELKHYNEQLSNQHEKFTAEHAETVRNFKVHAETLSQCYRQQLSEQEVRHNREIIELQSRLDKAPSPIDSIPVHPNMPREEGEGSESVESNPPPNSVHPIPLERLLDSKSDDEVMHLKKQLVEQESKVVHLTAILSDIEQDLVKHVQMNKLLKEEIRRQQRSVEREKHAENLEYLKNVVYKFVTLNSGDERCRLVPVLNTILKLSPDETQKLNMVAKGDPGFKAWASYLPMWSSPNKPQ